MSNHSHSTTTDLDELVEYARDLISATADVAGDQVSEARKRLGAALDSGRKLIGTAKGKAAEGMKAADQAVRERPYHAIGIALGAGALIGYLIARRRSRD